MKALMLLSVGAFCIGIWATIISLCIVRDFHSPYVLWPLKVVGGSVAMVIFIMIADAWDEEKKRRSISSP